MVSEHEFAIDRVTHPRERSRGTECQRALTQKQTLWGGGALELADLGLLEDGSELGDALDSDLVDAETAKERQSGDGERAGMSAGADTKANTWEVVRVHKQPTRATAASNCP